MNQFTRRNIYSFLDQILIGNVNGFMTLDQEYELLRYFREHYYTDATGYRHGQYLGVLFDFKALYNRYPSKKEFFLIFRRHTRCLCQYSAFLTEEHYLNACDFFMNKIGDIITPSCMDLYFHYEFYTLERRHPSSMNEFMQYIRRSFRGFEEDDVVPRAVDDEKINELKKTIEVISDKTCSICQEDIANHSAVKLECGHFYHANDTDCCETGTIFTWFLMSRKCPVCRAEI